MPRDFEEVEQWVREELAAARQIGLIDIAAVVPHPHSPVVACVLEVSDEASQPAKRKLAVVNLQSGQHEILDLGVDAAGLPAWSPDGERLAVLVDVKGVPSVWILADVKDSSTVRVSHRVPGINGAVEAMTWSPDGRRLAMVVASFGAQVSDVVGSGTVQQPESVATWRPLVSPQPQQGRRVAHVWEPGVDTPRELAPELNVWEAGWLGANSLVVLASEGAGEGAWYAASLAAVSLQGSVAPLFTSPTQLAQPMSSPSGSRWSVLSARASDRGLLAGRVLLGRQQATGEPAVIDTHGVDVTYHRWIGEHRILYAGIRRQQTVFGLVDTTSGHSQELLATDATSGLHQPALGGLSAHDELVVVLERHDQPPTLSLVGQGVTRSVLSTAGTGSAHILARGFTTTPVRWRSTDGLEIGGLLTLPRGEGPFPLVVHVHGGPVAAWLDGWLPKDPHTSLLVARGFAVLRPNPRGSAGRGQEYIEEVVGDMGGRDVDDLVCAVDALVDQGIAATGRIGISGNSYGGYMAAWVPCLSNRFAAAVSRSPVTEWRSQHLTSNLTEFDSVFVGGSAFDENSHYTSRSPLNHHREIHTPMLLTAGAKDLATPPAQAQMMHHALTEAQVPTQLAIYPEEGHGVRSHDALADQLARTICWFERYLGAPDTV